MAGAVVAVVALPLSMALAIASGVAPQHGLYTAIIGGIVAAVAGGSRYQITGPTAAFVVLLAPVTTNFGVGGLMIATLMAGVMLLTIGYAGLGRLISFIPHPVVTGFTLGIALVIATLQIPDFLGLTMHSKSAHFSDRVLEIAKATPSFRLPDFLVGVLTLAILILWARKPRKIPGPLIALSIATVVSVLARDLLGAPITTIQTRFSSIPSSFPPLSTPWSWGGPDGRPLDLTLDLFRQLAPSGFAIAMLGAIESLLSAVVADGMTGQKHHSDGELMGQGLANIAAPFFGGIAATGAIARTATNIRSGATSPLSAVFHCIFILSAMLALAPVLSLLPMPALAALLLIVAWNMSDVRHAFKILRVAPKSDRIVLATCFLLTVVFDMVVSVSVGIVLASLLFMRRMGQLFEIRLIGKESAERSLPIPHGVVIYQVVGPLFFGAAEQAMTALSNTGSHVRAVILDLHAVPVMDATGLVNLQSALDRLKRGRVRVVVVGPTAEVHRLLLDGGVLDNLDLRQTIDESIQLLTSGEDANLSPDVARPEDAPQRR